MSGSLKERMSYCDEDATLSPDGFPLIIGKENIETFLSRGMKMAKFEELALETALY